VIGALEAHVVLEDLIDPSVELNRIKKQMEKIEKTLHQIKQKLQNKNYVEKAPKAIVEKEKQKFNDATTQYEKLKKTKALFE